LGQALALKSSFLGAKVVVIGRTEKRLSKLIMDEPEIAGIQADVSVKEDIHKISGQTLGILGNIDVLINNASYLGSTPLKLLIDTECEDLSLALETNLIGPFRLIKAILPSMVLKNSGLIVNISSDAAVNVYGRWGGYSVSKTALDHLTSIWHQELKDHNIRFLSIDPGDMNTEMHLAAIPDADISQLYDPNDVAEDLLAFLAKNEFQQVRYSADQWRRVL
jgi:NAD(P)-dependent dehydrogenase (short-subunit alcohol dehydrogenase family)